MFTEIPPSPGLITAICYRCKFQEAQAELCSCPRCGFPMIRKLAAGPQPSRLRDIFDRTSVDVGVHLNAPPLPGVNVQQQQVKRLDEARRRRMTLPSRQVPVIAPPAASAAWAPADSLAGAPASAAPVLAASVTLASRWWSSRIGMTMAVLTAAMAGAAAALLHSSLL